MKVAFISQWYDPEEGSAAIPGVIARGIADLGHSVEVITGFPNYPGGKVFEGYRQRPQFREKLNGVWVNRVPLIPDHSSRGIARAVAYSSFASSATLFGQRVMSGCDVIFIYATPIFSALPAMVRSRFRPTPIITYVADLWPDTLKQSGLAGGGGVGRIAQGFATSFTNRAYRDSDILIATSRRMRNELITRGHNSDNVEVIYNWLDDRVMSSNQADLISRNRIPVGERPYTVMYAGNLGPLQELENLIRAAAQLRSNQDVSFRIVGTGQSEVKLRDLVRDLDLDNVSFYGHRSIDEVHDLQASADVQIISLRDDPLFEMTVPSKLQFCMAASLPSIVAAPGETADLALRSGSSFVVPPNDPKSLAQAILDMKALPKAEQCEMGRRGRIFYDQNFSKEVALGKLSRVLSRF